MVVYNIRKSPNYNKCAMSKPEHLPSHETNRSDSIERVVRGEPVLDKLDPVSGETMQELGAVACDMSPCQLCEHYREQKKTTVPRTDKVLVSAGMKARELMTATTSAGIGRMEQIRTEVQEARELLGILNTYVIPGMRNRDPNYNPKNATWVSVPPIIPVVKDPNSPFKHRPFTRTIVD